MDGLWLDDIPLNEIVDQFPAGTIPSSAARTRKHLYAQFRVIGADMVRRLLAPLVEAKRALKEVKSAKKVSRKKKHEEGGNEESIPALPGLMAEETNRDPNLFMETPTEEEKQESERCSPEKPVNTPSPIFLIITYLILGSPMSHIN
ncbi:hypothetical protein FRC03_005804 [Tulasnella sp. 419]|nr:hypothetical protein FRC03_005804 [Tulasnella sp. 419]